MANDFTYNLKTWAGEVAQSMHSCTGDPSQAMTDTIVKISQGELLNSDQVERLSAGGRSSFNPLQWPAPRRSKPKWD